MVYVFEPVWRLFSAFSVIWASFEAFFGFSSCFGPVLTHKKRYYQGMNDVGGFLVSYFDEITALAIFSGVEKHILRDFTS